MYLPSYTYTNCLYLLLNSFCIAKLSSSLCLQEAAPDCDSDTQPSETGETEERPDPAERPETALTPASTPVYRESSSIRLTTQPSASKRRKTSSPSPNQQAVLEASAVLKELSSKSVKADQYSSFGMTVASEIRNMPTEESRFDLMFKIMSVIKENKYSHSSVKTQPKPYYQSPRPTPDTAFKPPRVLQPWSRAPLPETGEEDDYGQRWMTFNENSNK